MVTATYALQQACLTHEVCGLMGLNNTRIVQMAKPADFLQVTEMEHRLRAADGGHAVAQEELTRLRSAAQVRLVTAADNGEG